MQAERRGNIQVETDIYIESLGRVIYQNMIKQSHLKRFLVSVHVSEVWPGPKDPGDVWRHQRPGPGVGGVELPQENQLGVHLLVQGPQPHLVQGAQGRLLHLDLQLPQARWGQGSQVKDPQSPEGSLSQAEQQLYYEGYI